MKQIKWLFAGLSFFLAGFLFSCNSGSPNGNLATLKLQLITDKIYDPVAMVIPVDGSGQIFICQKEGKIWVVNYGKVKHHPFLDVSMKINPINQDFDERGLLRVGIFS